MERENLKMLAGLGLGATLMYFLDPRGGRRRRALLRDKSIKASRKTREAVTGRAEDIRNRMKGAAHEMGLLHGEREPKHNPAPSMSSDALHHNAQTA